MFRYNAIYTPYFNSTERSIVYTALEEAAEYLRDFYRFSPREWFNYCYDVLTEGEVTSDPSHAHALAEVRQYQSALPSTSRDRYDHYQIRLYDRNILRKLWRHSDLEFYPFMVYILTHELIHIARFCQNLHPFDCDPEGLRKEEEKVDRLTCEVLKTKKSPCFHRISPIRSLPATPQAPARS